jgi:hypothetical protein
LQRVFGNIPLVDVGIVVTTPEGRDERPELREDDEPAG